MDRNKKVASITSCPSIICWPRPREPISTTPVVVEDREGLLFRTFQGVKLSGQPAVQPDSCRMIRRNEAPRSDPVPIVGTFRPFRDSRAFCDRRMQEVGDVSHFQVSSPPNSGSFVSHERPPFFVSTGGTPNRRARGASSAPVSRASCPRQQIHQTSKRPADPIRCGFLPSQADGCYKTSSFPAVPLQAGHPTEASHSGPVRPQARTPACPVACQRA